jgi:rubrerythrin
MPKSLSKTPAPKKDRIYGSDKNKVGSASSKASAKGIELNESILATLSQKAKDYNESHPKNKVSVATLKAVMRRGMGAYSTSHRPTITGGAPNSRQAWGFARVNKFLKKKAGQQVKAAYVQDDDLMADGGDVKKFAFIEKWEGGFYWLITKDGDNNYYNVDGDKRLSVVKDMAKRWGYNLVSKKQYEKMLSDSKLADGGETKKSKEAYTIVGVYKSTNDLGREESEDLTKEGLLGYRLRYNKMPTDYYGYVVYDDTESGLERAKGDYEKYNRGAAAEKERKKARDLENKIKREKQNIIDAQKLEAAKSDDTPKPAYLMTKSEYEDRVVPLLKEYEKFARKNDKYLSLTSYSGFYKVTFEQVLSRGLDGKKTGYYFRSNDEKQLIENWNERKFRKYDDFTIPAPTPKDVLEKNIAFFKDLNKFFDEKVIFDGLNSDYKKSNKSEIRRAIEDDTYKKMIENGEITEEEVIKIAEEQGVKVPKKVFSQESLLKKEAKKQMDEILSKIPKMNQDVFKSLYKQLFEDFKDVEKIVIERETERFEGLIKEYIELSQKEGGVNVEKLQTAIVFWRDIFIESQPRVVKTKDYRGYPIIENFYKDLELKSNYKPIMDKIILEYAESLKYRFLKAVLDNFPRVSKPISDVSRESLKVGKKGFEGRYRFNFADGSYFDFVTEAIPAAGYNIVSFHYRYITHLENATLADGTKIKGYYEIMQNFSSESMADGGSIGQEITCVNCGWHWNTSDSDESDKYICHKCGFDNRTFYDPEPIGFMADGGATDFGKVVSASSRFRPMETIVFDPPLVGLNGAKLISYTWSFQWDTSFTKSEGEAISKRVSDWTQADISAETGRDIVHKYTIQMPNGDLKVVSSDSVPVLLGYTDRAQKSSFPNLSNAAKTLAKQKLQLSIIEAKAKEKADAIAEIVAKGIPEVRVEEGGFRGYKFIIGDSVCLGDDPNDKERLECPKDGYIKNRLKEMGIDVYKDYNTYDLKNRIERQERKIKDILNGKTTAEMGMEIPSQHDLIKMELGLELFKPSKTIEQIAKEKDVPLDYAEEQLRKGMKTESEHSDNPIVQETIALQHLDEMIDYYEKLEYMERQNKMAQGGVTEFYKQYQDWYKGGVSDKMTIMVSVPNAFSKMSSEDNHVILDVFEKRDESVDGKEKLKELLELADKNEIDVYLEPIPRHNKIKDESKKEKITREYLISYYEKFGFELLPNGFMVRKHKNNKMEKGGQVPDEIKENPIYKILLEKSKQDSFTKVKVKMPSLDKINLFLRDIGIDVATPRQSKDFLKAGQFYTLIYGYEGQEPRKRTNYHIDISRLDGYYSRNTPYYAKEILKYIDDFYKENQMEKGGYYKAGGEINPDDKNVKDYFSHGSGNVGGVLVGKRHSEGGIKAVNKSTNQPLEMEGGEVVITRNAVSDDTKREFEGKMMTNREILSKINESGGGVSFADGGDIPETIHTSGKEYKYGGKMMKDHEIVSSCGCKHSMADGGEVKDANKLEIGDKIKISEGYQGTFIYEVLSGARQGVRPSEIVYQVKIIDSTEPNDYFHIGKVFYKMFTKRLGRFSKVNVLGKGGYMAQGGETDYQTELKNHLFPKIEVEVEVEVEPVIEEMMVDEHYITAEDLGLSDGMPMLAVGTIVYSSGGNDQWEVVSFSDDGVNLVNKPKSPLQSKMEDKHLTFDELIKYFKDKAISIKNISTERELEPAIALVKNKLPQKSFAVGGFIDGDEDEDAKIMQSQFGKSNFK